MKYIKTFKIVLILTTIFMQSQALADFKDYVKFNVGVDAYYINTDTGRYEYDKYDFVKNTQSYVRRVSAGVSIRLTPKDKYPILFGVRTNRVLNIPITSYGLDTKSKQYIRQNFQIFSDSLSLAFPLSQKIAVFTSYSFITEYASLTYGNGLETSQTIHTNLYGIGTSYAINKKLSTFVVYLLPNKDLNMRYGIGMGINYNF